MSASSEFEGFVVGIAHETQRIDDVIEKISICQTAVVSIDLRNSINELKSRWLALLPTVFEPALKNTSDTRKWLVDLRNEIVDWKNEHLSAFARNYSVIMAATKDSNATLATAMSSANVYTNPIGMAATVEMQKMMDKWISAFPASLKSFGQNRVSTISDRCVAIYDAYRRDQFTIAPDARVSMGLGPMIDVSDTHISSLFIPPGGVAMNTLHNRSLLVISQNKPTALKVFGVLNDDERTTKMGIFVDAVTSAVVQDSVLAEFRVGGLSLIGNFLAPPAFLMTSYNDTNTRQIPTEVGFGLKLFRTTGYGTSSADTREVTNQSVTKIAGVQGEVVMHIPGDASNSIVYDLRIVNILTPTAGSTYLLGVEWKFVSFSTPSAGAAVLLGNTLSANAERYFSQYIGACSYPMIEKVLPASIREAFDMLRQYYSFCIFSGIRVGIATALLADYRDRTDPSATLDGRCTTLSWWLAPTSDISQIAKASLYTKFWQRMLDYLRMAAIDGDFHQWLQDGL